MTIAVVCPHCDSQFNLQSELIGKSMRCPNADCREIFTVESQAPLPPEEPSSLPAMVVPLTKTKIAPPPSVLFLEGEAVPVPVRDDRPSALPYDRVESDPVAVVPVVEGEQPVSLPKRNAERTQPMPRLPTPSQSTLFETDLDDERPRAKEKNWKKAPPPPAADVEEEVKPEPKRIRRTEQTIRDDEPLPNRRGPGVWKFVLAGMVAIILGIGAYTGIQYLLNVAREEEMMAKEASEEFKKQNYTAAVKLYEGLQEKFPSSNEMPKYVFFGKLGDLNSIVSSVAIKDLPADGQKKFEEFLKEYADSPLSKPTDTGYGYDIFEAGRKLVDAFAENSEQNLKSFVADRKQRELLDTAEKSTTDGRRLIPIVERYRIKEVKPLDDQRARFDTLAGKFVRERDRLRVIDPYRDLANDPTDRRIAEFVSSLQKSRFDTDGEAVQLVTEAKAELRRLIRGIVDFRPPLPPPLDNSGGLTFVSAPLGQAQIPIIAPADALPEQFFATARGILYAFDPESGNLLWATRVGRSATDVPARIPERVGIPELVLVPTERDGFGLVARVARTGEPRWYQPLEAPLAGTPVLVGQRIFVPLRDELGTVVEIESSTGNRLSHIRLRQRIGTGAVVQPGTSTFFVAAEARRIFALNAELFDAEGNRQPVRCTQVLATEHPELSLKVPPVIAGPAGDAKGNRYLILAQADGTQSTKLLAFPILPAAEFDPALGPPEVVAKLAGATSLPGHVLFPPHTDGERVAVVTDAGAFGLFGTNQSGNTDPSIYPIPGVSLTVDLKNPVPGQVVSAEEDTFWAVARGKLTRMRLGVTPKMGLQVSTDSLSQAVGIPVQVPQLNLRRDLALLVVRSEDSDGLRAIAFDPRDGRQRWQRKLGVAPATPPITTDTATVLADEDAGVYVLPNRAVAAATEKTVSIANEWIAASPVPTAVAAAQMCANRDGSRVWVLVPERGDKDSLRLRIRSISQGKMQPDVFLQLPDKPCARPVCSGNGVAFPCADGFLYRYEPGIEKLQQGPMWRGEGIAPSEPCFVSSFADNEFLTTDGGKAVTRWRWTNAADAKAVAGPWTLREKIPFAPVLVSLSDTETRLFVAELGGNVWMYDGDATGEPLRRWRAAKDDPNNSIPAGRPTTGFVVSRTDAGIVVVYSVENRHIVAISPSAETAFWVVRRLGSADTLGGVAHKNSFLFTDLTGIVTAYDRTTGDRLGTIRAQNSSLLPRSSAIPIGDGKTLILPMLDGSTVVLPNPSG